ncbi:MAG TPA: glutathione peroxidase [Myxococcota bacterium]
MSLFDIEATTISGEPRPLRDFAGNVILVVNVASKCGFTPQYEGLEALYRQYKDRGFVILGFPCDQFGNQEPGQDAEIAAYCRLTWDVSFPMFAKVEVNGDGAHPLFRHLKKAAPGLLGTESIKWNFTKFLIDREGHVVERYGSRDEPKALAKDIEKLLARA